MTITVVPPVNALSRVKASYAQWAPTVKWLQIQNVHPVLAFAPQNPYVNQILCTQIHVILEPRWLTMSPVKSCFAMKVKVFILRPLD
jgi:hypothetical protein